ncbi:uncharacterized protein LOC116249787 [Nymphaea colorata]|nr:uncharacterized protein LOC116249787 [Nymphaea colorata]
MLRTRLLFFTLGFATTGAAISHFVWRDLWAAHHSTSSQVKDKFGFLDSRVSNLEAMLSQTPQTVQDDG